MTSPTTPFSQTTLPSRSLLSRQDSTNNETPAPETSGFTNGSVIVPKLALNTQKALQTVIRRIFERCFQEGAYRQVIGIAVEARNLEVLREAVLRASDDKGAKAKARISQAKGEEIIEYLLDICMNIVQERGLRDEILQLILDMLASHSIANPDYFAIAKCMVYLGLSSKASELLRTLVESHDSKSKAVAYQVSFDLLENGTQDFLNKVMDDLPKTAEEKSEFAGANGHASQPNNSEGAQESDQLLAAAENREAAAATTTTVPSRPKDSKLSEDQKKAYTNVREILTGTKSLELNLEFLYRANKSDRQVLTKLKNSLEARHSIFHNAVCLANAFNNSGTTSDWFIRENLDWLQKAVNWSKFSVTASLGVIHRGNIGQGRKLLEPYLRDPSSGSGSAYSKGGALYGLGLIYTNHGKHVSEYLYDQLRRASTDEIVQHGAALGLGVAGMASGDDTLVDELKSALWQESAISGQAAGISMGLVLLGTGNVTAIRDMVSYAQETEHEKTVRGLAVGLALIMYGQQEAADVMINGLLDDPNPILRYGGIFTIAMAYCGTGSNKAVRRLLHVAVSDVNDDVRRVAVMSLGFVLFRKPTAVPRMVELLAESYNPHVRYGATMALGIACAGTGLEEAVDLLEPMMKDSTDFVRQGTLISLAMIMVQQTEAMNPKVATIRQHLLKVVSDRHEDAMAKFGAALALGIIDAGGRNSNIGLQTPTGNLNMSAVVGMAVFTQYWYWFPFSHFLSLAFTPTSVIGVDADLEVPQVKLHCNARPSLFEYPPSMEVKQEEAPEKVKTAVLSTTAQAKRRKMAKEKQQRGDGMDIDVAPGTPKAGAADDEMDIDDDAGKDGDKDKDDAATPAGKRRNEGKEKAGFELDNMSRVLPTQLKYTTFPDGRYAPVKKVIYSSRRPSLNSKLTEHQLSGGVILLADAHPSEPKSLIERQVKKPAPAPARNTAAGVPSGSAAAAAAAAMGGLGAAGIAPQTPAGQTTGASARRGGDDAAAVLNAVDEDEEGVPEAELPREFGYESDGEGGGED